MLYSSWLEKTKFEIKWYEFSNLKDESTIPVLIEWLSENIEPAEPRDKYDYHSKIQYHGITVKWVLLGVYVGQELTVRIKDPKHAIQFKLMGF